MLMPNVDARKSDTCTVIKGFPHRKSTTAFKGYIANSCKMDENKKIDPYAASESDKAWRDSIRHQLEKELNERVHDVLCSQLSHYSTKNSHQRHQQDDNRQLTAFNNDFGIHSQNMVEKTEREKQYIQAQRWKAFNVNQHLRKFISQNNFVNFSHTYNNSNNILYKLNNRGNQDQDFEILDIYGNISEFPDDYKTRKYYARTVERAMCDFGELTASEKHSYYYCFTRNGFLDAIKTGKLPDGSHLEELKSGKFKDHFGFIRDKNGPFWPVDFGPMQPAPTLKRTISKNTETLVSQIETCDVPKENLATKFPGRWRGCLIVYDAEKFPKDYIPTSLPEGHCQSLIFESRFESGNLLQARRVGQFDYELILRTDLYTKRHTQWYYFQVKNALKDVSYTFKIINLLKKDSLYAYGMQPLLYSEHLASTHNIGWIRAGHHISYSKNVNNLQCPLLARDRNYYILEWKMEFPSNDDTCYLAHCYPYTFSDLQNDLDALETDPKRSVFMKRDVLCLTRAGNSCFLLTISDFEASSMTEKKTVVVTARVHPGETNSSWVMKGILDYITGPSDFASALRKQFVFKIIPMINPDGVIVGNYRCSLSGRDLNRNYRNPSKENFPTIWHLKDMIAQLNTTSEVLLYCDLHGHSRKQNVFMYGCTPEYQKTEIVQPEVYLRSRIIPWLMAKQAPEKFEFDGCKFHIRRCKESTGRVVMFRQLNIINSYTLEATFCGTTLCQGEKRHFNTSDFEDIGRIFCEATLEYKKTQEDKEFGANIICELSKHFMDHLLTLQNCFLPQIVRSTDEPEQEGMNVQDHSEEECLIFMKQIQLVDHIDESDSCSDSDSESEPEFTPIKSRIHRRKKKHKKNKNKNKSGLESDDPKKVKNEKFQENEENADNGKTGLPSIYNENESDGQQAKKQISTIDKDAKRKFKSFPYFVNKYEGRRNGGIPCYSEERLLVRAAKKTAAVQKKYDDEQKQRDEEYYTCLEELNLQSTNNVSPSELAEYGTSLHRLRQTRHWTDQNQFPNLGSDTDNKFKTFGRSEQLPFFIQPSSSAINPHQSDDSDLMYHGRAIFHRLSNINEKLQHSSVNRESSMLSVNLMDGMAGLPAMQKVPGLTTTTCNNTQDIRPQTEPKQNKKWTFEGFNHVLLPENPNHGKNTDMSNLYSRSNSNFQRFE